MHTITNQYLAQHGGINLRQYKARQVVERRRDVRAAEGIIVSVLMGANAIIWTYVFVRWFVG